MRPTVQVRMVDAGDLHLTWRWLGGPTAYGTAQAHADETDAAVASLHDVLPATGEDLPAVLADGPWTDPRREADLARMLGRELWPAPLTEQLRQVADRLGRPVVKIQPSPRVARVPWEMLAVDQDTRLVEFADIATAAPVSLRSRPPADEGRTEDVVLVLDPRVPGFREGSALGSVLGPVAADPTLRALVERHRLAGTGWPRAADPAETVGRTDLDREWLSQALRRRPRRLLYVGHVGSSPVEGGQSEDARMHLCCGGHTVGYAHVMRRHRPLAAKDLLLGTLALRPDGEPGRALWPSPPRVALIACESGGELRFAESFGLATAFLHNGAELVTASRWPLPTSFAFHRFAGLDGSVRPLSTLIDAVDLAHDDTDPVAALASWQRERLKRWRSDGDVASSPLLWAAMTTIVV